MLDVCKSLGWLRSWVDHLFGILSRSLIENLNASIPFLRLTHTCTHARMNAHTHAWTHTPTHTRTPTHTHTQPHTHTHIRIWTSSRYCLHFWCSDCFSFEITFPSHSADPHSIEYAWKHYLGIGHWSWNIHLLAWYVSNKVHSSGCSIAQWLAYLLLDPAALGSDPSVPDFFQRNKLLSLINGTA